MRYKFLNLPPSELLTTKVQALNAEYQRMRSEHERVGAEVRHLAGPGAIAQAEGADADAAEQAARRGDDPGQVGTPASDRRVAALRTAEHAAAGYERALRHVEDEISVAFAEAAKSDTASGRTRRDKCAVAYRRSLDALEKARADYLAASGFCSYVEHAASGPSERHPAVLSSVVDTPVAFPRPENVGIPASVWPTLTISDVLAAMKRESNE